MGFSKFNNGAECVEEVKRLAATLPHRDADPYAIISGTPMESLWPSKGVTMGLNGTSDLYDTVAWGEDRSTPWGPLPACILAIRHDIAVAIDPSYATAKDRKPVSDAVKKAVQVMHDETVRACKQEEKPKEPLMGPDWKPAPGFERPW